MALALMITSSYLARRHVASGGPKWSVLHRPDLQVAGMLLRYQESTGKHYARGVTRETNDPLFWQLAGDW
jgi:hypothetical protein